MRKKSIHIFILLLILPVLLTVGGCGKNFLDRNPDKSQKVPASLDDLWAILNFTQTKVTSLELAINSSDEFYLTDQQWNMLNSGGLGYQSAAYSWEKELYPDQSVLDWDRPYGHILYTHIVLEGLEKIKRESDPSQWDLIRGSALFYRAYSYYQLAQNFCSPYSKVSADTDLGVPLRMDSDHGTLVGRSTLQQTYDFILRDLEQAVELLPNQTKHLFFAPSRVAAYAMLAKTHLVMGRYDQSLDFAEKCLSIQGGLLDFNHLPINNPIPFSPLDVVLYNPSLNPEVILYASIKGMGQGFTKMAFHPDQSQIDTNLIKLYHPNDLRKDVYFSRKSASSMDYIFRSSYSGISNGSFDAADRSGGFFGGLATDEIYLIQAESLIRTGRVVEGIKVLNKMLKNRFKTGTYEDYVTTEQVTALRYVLEERRKELAFRGTRWEDLRRWNQESEFAITLRRTINGTSYTLEPNSKRYTFPIPDQEISMGGVKQNDR